MNNAKIKQNEIMIVNAAKSGEYPSIVAIAEGLSISYKQAYYALNKYKLDPREFFDAKIIDEARSGKYSSMKALSDKLGLSYRRVSYALKKRGIKI